MARHHKMTQDSLGDVVSIYDAFEACQAEAKEYQGRFKEDRPALGLCVSEANQVGTALRWILTGMDSSRKPSIQPIDHAQVATELAGFEARGFAYILERERYKSLDLVGSADDDGSRTEQNPHLQRTMPLFRRLLRRVLKAAGKGDSSLHNYTSALRKFLVWADARGYGVFEQPVDQACQADSEGCTRVVASEKMITQMVAADSMPNRREWQKTMNDTPYGYYPRAQEDGKRLSNWTRLATEYAERAQRHRSIAEELRAMSAQARRPDKQILALKASCMERAAAADERLAREKAALAAQESARLSGCRWTKNQQQEYDRLVDFALRARPGITGKDTISEGTLKTIRGALGSFFGALTTATNDGMGAPNLGRDFGPSEMVAMAQNEASWQAYLDFMFERHKVTCEDEEPAPRQAEITLQWVGWVVQHYWIPLMRRACCGYARWLVGERQLPKRFDDQELWERLRSMALRTAYEQHLLERTSQKVADPAYTVRLLTQVAHMDYDEYERCIWGDHLRHSEDDAARAEVSRSAVTAYRVLQGVFLPRKRRVEAERAKRLVADAMPSVPQVIEEVALPMWRGAQWVWKNEGDVIRASAMARDALMLLLMVVIPLRIRNWRMARFGEGDKGNLRRSMSGSVTYRFVFGPGQLKARKKTLDAELPEWVNPYLEAYFGYAEFVQDDPRSPHQELLRARPTTHTIMECEDHVDAGSDSRGGRPKDAGEKRGPVAFPVAGGGVAGAGHFYHRLARWVASSPDSLVASFPFFPHSARHIFACFWLRQSWLLLELVADCLGDEINVVKKYYSVIDQGRSVKEIGGAMLQTQLLAHKSLKDARALGLPNHVENQIGRACPSHLRDYLNWPDDQLQGFFGLDDLVQVESARKLIRARLDDMESQPTSTVSLIQSINGNGGHGVHIGRRSAIGR
jgi:hypothetical protein